MINIPNEAHLTPQEERRKERKRLRRYQDRLVAIHKIASRWLEFEKTVLSNEEYHRVINKLVAQISQKRTIENNKLQSVRNGQRTQHVTYSWGTARDEILTIEKVEEVSRRFGFTFDEVHSHVGKVANHAKWLSDIYARGEGGMLMDVNRDLQPLKYPRPMIMRPATPEPLILRAIEIKTLVARANQEFKRAEEEFHSDDLPKPPKTIEFGFVEEVEQRTSRLSPYSTKHGKRKRRRNWRTEAN